MIFCEKCGTQNRDTAKFCTRCGQLLEKKIQNQKIPSDYEDRKYEMIVAGDPDIKRMKARKIIQTAAISLAGLVILPLPFSDIFFLVPVQCSMVYAIGQVYDSNEDIHKVISELLAASGFSVFGEITALVLANFLPVIGKLISAPFIYGWTCGMGEIAIKYFETKGNIDYSEIRDIYNKTAWESGQNYKWQDKTSPDESLEKLKEYISEDEYRNIKDRFQ